jgi:hypothetical protein
VPHLFKPSPLDFKITANFIFVGICYTTLNIMRNSKDEFEGELRFGTIPDTAVGGNSIRFDVLLLILQMRKLFLTFLRLDFLLDPNQ